MKVKIGKYHKGPADRTTDVVIDEYDTWGLDHTLAMIILPALIQLKHTKNGVPSEFCGGIGSDMDRNYCFDFIKEDENKVFDEKCEKWDEVFDKMIWSFQQIVVDEYDSKYHHGTPDYGFEPIQEINPVTGFKEKMYQMVDRNPGEHWYDHAGHMLHEERIQEGLELFGKYYRSLWD
jgi:hypothetical protein